MSMQYKNYLKITLFKVKICNDKEIGNFKLKMSIGNSYYDTDKITTREFEFGGKVIIIIYNHNHNTYNIL